MRVLQVIAGQRHGGAEAFFERLVIALARTGIVEHLAIRRDAERAARLDAAGLAPLQARFGGPLDVATRLMLAGEIRRFRPQVTLAWMSRAAACLPPRWLAGDSSVRVGRLGGYYDLKYYRHCDHLVANTPDIAAYIGRSGWPADRVHYLPNFVHAVGAEPASRREAGIVDGNLLVLALGRLHPNKAFDVLIAAVAKSPGVSLWLAGEGELRANLESQVERLGLRDRVRFLNWRSDVEALMAASDIVVCPSRHEPLGNVILEAWAQQRPVIAAASAGPAGLVRDGKDGILVPVDDADALAAAIGRLARDAALRGALASAGHERYRNEFTEAAVVERYVDFFRRVTL
jgi:glycosyltransferase involved in cell wall biosynthesis